MERQGVGLCHIRWAPRHKRCTAALVWHRLFACITCKNKNHSTVRNSDGELPAEWTLLCSDLQDWSSPQTAGSGIAPRRPLGAAEPAVSNLFDGHGKFITRPDILVCHMAGGCISASGPGKRKTEFPGSDCRSYPAGMDPS